MLELLLLVIVVIVVVSYAKYDAVSPKTVIRLFAHYAGIGIKSTPHAIKATTSTIKRINADVDLEIARSGKHLDIGFKEGSTYADTEIIPSMKAYTTAQERSEKAARLRIERLEAKAKDLGL